MRSEMTPTLVLRLKYHITLLEPPEIEGKIRKKLASGCRIWMIAYLSGRQNTSFGKCEYPTGIVVGSDLKD